ALLPLFGGMGVGLLDDGAEAGRQGVDVAEDRRRRQSLGRRGGGGLDLAGVSGAGGESALHQRHLGGQVVVAPPEVCVGGLVLTGLPRADDALAVGGGQTPRAVVVDEAEPVWVASRRRQHGGRCSDGSRTGARRSWP